MAITRIKTWITGEVLTAGDLNSEFDNAINNALSLISPLTGNLDFGTNKLLGASPIIEVSPEDARTASVDVGLVVRSTTSGTPAANIGTGIQVDVESADENPCPSGRLDFVLTDITAGSEDSVLDILLRTAGAALGSRYRFQATGAFLATITHALTAARTITLPDDSVTLASLTGTEILTNKTLTTPTISATGWSNANHAHAAANSGGTISVTVQQNTVRKTTDFTTTSTSFVDVTDLSITLTTAARRCLVTFSGDTQIAVAGQQTKLTLDIDGSNKGGTNGLVLCENTGSDQPYSGAFSYLTDVLTAASHTFKVQILGSSGAGTTTLRGNPTALFNVIEILPSS